MPIKPENKHLYPDNWKEIRKAILKRANDCCEFCGVENYDVKFDTGAKIILTIAHLDHNPTNNNPENLRALCQRCHNRHDIEHRKNTRAKTRIKKMNNMVLFE